ncbi:MAG: N-acetyl-gamma-glutamyl-phosphate reductase [Acidobacteriia bacterium]|jgi:N-acetyl-gamma-glutamyl-phosphate reductase|nr:N-acetyl-gamma-glutamyl-phosphate reductase [Terriglobia bacterium]
MASKLKTAILGATGYSGFELARLLLRHPGVETPVMLQRSGDTAVEVNLADMYPAISGNGGYPLQPWSWPELKRQKIELLFLATPHEVSRALVPEAIAHGLRVVDLSGAWRLREAQNRAVYGFHDADGVTAAALMKKAVYGLPELYGDCLPGAALVANPGCYATSVILALAPLLAADIVDREKGIISDSKSGVSGAGKEATARTHFVSVADNLSAYSVFGHRHVGEILEQLKLDSGELIFTPHLLPIPRGILSTIYVHLKQQMHAAEVESCFHDFYSGKPWVRVFATPKLPQIQFSLHTNYCDLGFCLAKDGRRLVLVSCIDNLLKGAAGQAVQNMNLMYGFKEQEGLQ